MNDLYDERETNLFCTINHYFNACTNGHETRTNMVKKVAECENVIKWNRPTLSSIRLFRRIDVACDKR